MIRLVAAPGIAVENDAGVVHLARMPSGPILVLEGGAATVWECACDQDEDSVADRVARAVGAEPEAVQEDVRAFLDELISQRVLLREEAG